MVLLSNILSTKRHEHSWIWLSSLASILSLLTFFFTCSSWILSIPHRSSLSEPNDDLSLTLSSAGFVAFAGEWRQPPITPLCEWQNFGRPHGQRNEKKLALPRLPKNVFQSSLKNNVFWNLIFFWRNLNCQFLVKWWTILKTQVFSFFQSSFAANPDSKIWFLSWFDLHGTKTVRYLGTCWLDQLSWSCLFHQVCIPFFSEKIF